MSKNTNTKKHTKETTSELATAFDKTAAARAALEPHEIVPINLDIEATFSTVLGVIGRLGTFRDQIVKELPAFEIGNLDDLQVYAEALADAQDTYRAASEPAEPLPDLAAKGMAHRDVFSADVIALSKRGLMDGRRLDELKGGPGYLNIAADLGLLTKLFREHWDTVATKTGVQISEVEDAENIRKRIARAFGERAQQPAIVAVSAEERQRAYTLLVRAYDQTRRAILYLRWDQGDADKIAPSLWAGRTARSASSNTAPAVNAPGGGTPAPGEVAPKPGAADAVNAPHAAPQAPVNAPAVAGLPGGSPFTNN